MSLRSSRPAEWEEARRLFPLVFTPPEVTSREAERQFGQYLEWLYRRRADRIERDLRRRRAALPWWSFAALSSGLLFVFGEWNPHVRAAVAVLLGLTLGAALICLWPMATDAWWRLYGRRELARHRARQASAARHGAAR